MLQVTVKVTNTGTRAGKEVVQLYVMDVESTVIRPVKELKQFAKVELQSGEQHKFVCSLEWLLKGNGVQNTEFSKDDSASLELSNF